MKKQQEQTEQSNGRIEKAAEMLWTTLANVDGGSWKNQSPEWIKAAIHWRDYYLSCARGGRNDKG